MTAGSDEVEHKPKLSTTQKIEALIRSVTMQCISLSIVLMVHSYAFWEIYFILKQTPGKNEAEILGGTLASMVCFLFAESVPAIGIPIPIEEELKGLQGGNSLLAPMFAVSSSGVLAIIIAIRNGTFIPVLHVIMYAVSVVPLLYLTIHWFVNWTPSQ